jgi:hypothetical protein
MALSEIIESMAQALQAKADGGFRQAGRLLGDEKAVLREQLQAQTAPEIAAVIRKLRAEQDISQEEIDLVRLWIVGDAAGYLQAENDFQHWLDEFARLRESLTGYLDRNLDSGEIVILQGILEDAVRVSFDIANYLEKKERVENFDATTRDPGRINKAVLATLLSRKLESGDS